MDATQPVTTASVSKVAIPSVFTAQAEPKETHSIPFYELILYGVCLVIICSVSFSRTHDSIYPLTNMFTKAFVTTSNSDVKPFNEIAQHDGRDFWQAMKGPIFSRLYNIPPGESEPEADYGYFIHENRVLGVARLRQVRVKPNSCTLHKAFARRNFTQTCYASYATKHEERNPFGGNVSRPLTSSAWNYTPASETGGVEHEGMVSTYDGGGYVQLLTRNATQTMDILRELEKHSWIDRATRAVFFDMYVYNPNVNLFSHIRLLAEYPSAGGAVASTVVQAVKLVQYMSLVEYVFLVCEIIFMLIVIVQIIQCVIEIVRQKRLYFFNMWNWIHLLAIILALIFLLYQLLTFLAVRKYLSDLLKIEDQYPHFRQLFAWTINADFYLSLSLAMTWLKSFKYLNLNKTMLLLNKTLSASIDQIFAFVCVLSIIFIAYAQFGWLYFGRYLTEWREFSGSAYTLFRMIIGDFDFTALLTVNAIVGPVFLFSYIYFVYFVLLNMFLAIINYTYAQIATETWQTFQIQGLLGLLRKQKPAVARVDLKQPAVPPDDDTNRDGNVDKDEREMLQDDVDNAPPQIEETLDTGKAGIDKKLSYEAFLELNERVYGIESAIVAYVDKIEEILTDLDGMQRMSLDKEQVLANIPNKSPISNEV